LKRILEENSALHHNDIILYVVKLRNQIESGTFILFYFFKKFTVKLKVKSKTSKKFKKGILFVSERTFTFAICYRPSVCRLSVVCLSSVTLVRPQAVQSFESVDIHWKFHGDRPRGTPPPGELNTRGVAKYSDFGPIDGYISETVQDRW